MNRVRQIEDALAEAIRYRIAGSDVSIEGATGTRFARVYHHGCPSEHGGSAIAAEINLTALAVDIERALS